MNTLILYDSKFGNTKQIAEAIGSSLDPFDFAAEPIAKLLARKGGNLVVPPAGFIVTDTGPLKEGELERVPAWIKS